METRERWQWDARMQTVPTPHERLHTHSNTHARLVQVEDTIPNKAPICAAVVRIQDVRGARVSVPLLWHGTMAYTPRGVVERHFNLMPDKVFRANLAALQTDETLLNDLSGDFEFGGHCHLLEATSQELRFLKLAEVVGARSSAVQLISVFMAAGICHVQTVPASTIDGLLAVACSPPPTTELTASNVRELLTAATVVIPVPASLPEAVAACPDGAYSLALEEHSQLREQLAAFAEWAQNPLQPSRGGAAVADATIGNTTQAARAILGFAYNVIHTDGTPDLRALLDGELLAKYVSWAGTTRLKKPLSISLEVSCVVRILDYIGSGPVRLDEPNRAELEKLKSALRRLASQLAGMHKPVTCIPELEAAGKWAEFSLVQERVGTEAASVLRLAEDEATRTPQLARRVHDSFMSCLVTLDSAPNRPGCLRVLKLPSFTGPCECGDASCAGNRFVGTAMVLTHTKTSRSRDAIRVDFGGTATGQLLAHHAGWAHSMLLASDGDGDFSVWLNTRGRPFGSDESFSAYLPRVLAKLELPHLSFTTLRHAAIVASAEWATKEEMEGLARSIGTSVRKCAEVYDYRHSERAAGRFLDAYRSRAGGSSPDDSNSPPSPPAELQTTPPESTELAPATEPPGETPRAGMFQRFAGTLSRFVGIGSSVVGMPADTEPTPVATGCSSPAFVLEDEPVLKRTTAFKPAPLLALPAPAAADRALIVPMASKPRVRARVEDGSSFAEFLAARKRQSTGGPGRPAAQVLRRISRLDAEEALRSGVSAMRAVYAWAYGYETTSGRLDWLRSKVMDAIDDSE